MVKILVNRPARKQTMTMVTANGQRYSMKSTPPQITYSNNPRFGTVDREGRKAITRLVGPGLKRLSFTHVVASLDYTKDIQHAATRFSAHAGAGTKVRFTGGSAYETGVWWFIEDLQSEIVQRATNNRPSYVKLSWSLVEAVDVTTRIARTPKPKKPVARRATPAKPVTRTHKVKRGDTLWDISRKYLGNGLRWREIYNLNRSKINNPHWIYPGQVFKIPGR